MGQSLNYPNWHWSTVFSKQARVFSQNGEDGVLLYLLSIIPESKCPRYSFEIGAGIVNGNLECNTIILLENGWQGHIIDAKEINHRLCTKAVVTLDNINNLMTEKCGVLSIDIDGSDYWLWEKIYQNPAIVIIEYNAHIDPNERLVSPYFQEMTWNGTDFFGASAGAIIDLAHRKGYKLVCAVHCLNLFFVLKDLLPINFEEYPLDRLGPIKRHATNLDGRKYINV